MFRGRELKNEAKRQLEAANRARECPYCKKRLDEIFEHSQRGHKD